MNGSSNLQAEIKLALLGTTGHGTEARIICPACSGGRSSESSMCVNLETGWYICYRANCGCRGRLKGKHSSEISERTQPSIPAADDVPDARTLASIPTRIRQRFSWPVGTARGRVRFEVHDLHGDPQGCVLRSYTGQVPKALTYVGDYCGLHFPRAVYGTSVTLVEDMPSAEALAPYTPCVALNGAQLTREAEEYLLRSGITEVIFALDEDAKARSIQNSRMISLDCRVLLLEKDPKDMSTHELLHTVQRLEELWQ